MRDPELVFKAQLAASALERAWQHWRVIHGLLADPMPAVSSYVGYSLEEPWGQPRVVFGLAAADAEQLAALLERHDCIGPVHVMTAAQQGRNEVLAGAGDIAARPLPVPPQAPSLHAEPMISGDRVYRTAGIGAGPGPADDEDGPVYRQLAAALRAARNAGAAVQTREPETAVDEPAGLDRADQNRAAQDQAGQDRPGQDAAAQDPVAQDVAPQEPVAQDPVAQDAAAQDPVAQDPVALDPTAQDPVAHDSVAQDAPAQDRSDGDSDGPSGHAEDIGAADTDSRTSGKSVNSRTSDSASRNRGPRKSDSDAVGPRKAANRRAGAGRGGHDRSAASRAGADAGGDAANDASPDPDRQDLAAQPTAAAPDVLGGGDANAASADGDAAGQTAHRIGPLALAASAARIAAEARIRAAAQEASASAMERPKAPELDEASAASSDSPKETGPGSSDIAAVWGAPGFATGADEEPEVARFWPWSQPATNAEGDPEPGRPAAEEQEQPQASHARRNRVARGYTIPRLSRAKRPGAVSGP